jgi:phosphoribosylformylglycinamidine cyclo-ligase
MAHITGGGITENLPRVLPEGLQARVETASWRVPQLFQWLQNMGGVPEQDMRRSFNMGIGLVIVCAEADAAGLLERLAPEQPRVIGSIQPGQTGVVYA